MAPADKGGSRKLVIVGDSAFAQIACEYFRCDTDYDVVGFCVERAYLKQSALLGLPVVAFEEVERHFAPHAHSVFVAATYTQLNRLRTRLAQAAKAKGYALASYVSPRAFVWRNVELGEHCFIFEDNTIQPFVRIGSNVVLWSGNHIGHHSVIRDNCFIASHAVISGFVDLGENCFVGVNATISNNLTIGPDCLIGAGALVTRDVEADRVVRCAPSEASGSARRLFRVDAAKAA
jgi:sugar O-acyltransferase (sialic acid O-acetyltransferase NeuD family)